MTIIFLLFFCAGCQEKPDLAASNNGTQPDIILISIDTLRADHLGCYGNKDAITPNLDRLASEGVLFENAFTTVPITLPAHASLLSGLIPPNHGVRDNGADQLVDSIETIAEVLQVHGYQTVAFIAAEPLKDRGLSQGFEIFDDKIDGRNPAAQHILRSDRYAEQVAAQAAGWIHTADSDRPVFAFVHFFDPHSPYEKSLPGQKEKSYSGEIAHVDRVIGKLLKSIDTDRDAANRIVVVVSDHGEGLGEHGEKTHCIFVYDSTLHIPFIIHAPGRVEPERIMEPVGIIDVAPTLLELANDTGFEDADGISLLSTLNSGHAVERELYFESLYGELRFGWAPLRGIRRGEMKFINGPTPELYNLAEDPHELNNLFDKDSPLVSEFKSVLANVGEGKRTIGELDEEAIRKLASLGYVSARPTATVERENRPDPKDRIEVYELFSEVYQKYQLGALDEALNMMSGLEQAMSLSPHFYSEWAFFQSQAEQWKDATLSYQRCLELAPNFKDARLNLAATQIKTEDFADAKENLDLVIAVDPDNPQAYLYAGFCSQQMGDRDATLKYWRQFVKLAPNHPEAAKIRNALQ